MQKQDLRQLVIFLKVSEVTLTLLSQSAKRIFYKKSTLIFEQNITRNTFSYIISGWVKLFKESADGDEIIIDILTKDNYCGDEFFFDTTFKDIYSMRSVTDVELLTWPLPLLKNLLLADHELSLGFLEGAIKKRQHNYLETEHLSIQNASQRIGCFILRLCNQDDGQTLTVELPYNKVLLATHLGIRAETFSRALKKLGTDCGLKIHDNHIEISHRNTLVNYVCKDCSRCFPCHEQV